MFLTRRGKVILFIHRNMHFIIHASKIIHDLIFTIWKVWASSISFSCKRKMHVKLPSFSCLLSEKSLVLLFQTMWPAFSLFICTVDLLPWATICTGSILIHVEVRNCVSYLLLYHINENSCVLAAVYAFFIAICVQSWWNINLFPCNLWRIFSMVAVLL